MPKVPRKTDSRRIARLVNELGDIRQEMGRLAEREDKIKRKLLDAGIIGYQTSKYICKILSYTRCNVDYPGLVKHLKTSDMLIRRFTKLVSIVSAKVTPK